MSKPTILFGLQPEIRDLFFTDEHLDQLRQLGDLVMPPDTTWSDWTVFGDAAERAEIVITGWQTPLTTIAELPNLKMVVHSAGTVRHIFPEETYQHGVRVSSQTEVNALPVSEYTVAMILLAAKGTWKAARLYASRRAQVAWLTEFPTVGVYRAKIGLIGLSRISRRVIELLAPYEVEIQVFSKYLSDDEAQAMGVRSVSLDDLLRDCDVVSLHSADLPQNRGMIGAREAALIKDGATFINTARGRLVDQDALIEELRLDRFDAILDVAEPDITVPESPLWDLPNVLLTPHFAGSVGREMQRLGAHSVQDVAAFIEGRPIPGEIPAADYQKWA